MEAGVSARRRSWSPPSDREPSRRVPTDEIVVVCRSLQRSAALLERTLGAAASWPTAPAGCRWACALGRGCSPWGASRSRRPRPRRQRRRRGRLLRPRASASSRAWSTSSKGRCCAVAPRPRPMRWPCARCRCRRSTSCGSPMTRRRPGPLTPTACWPRPMRAERRCWARGGTRRQGRRRRPASHRRARGARTAAR